MHRWRISFTVLFVYSRLFAKPEPDPKPGFSKKAPGLESLIAITISDGPRTVTCYLLTVARSCYRSKMAAYICKHNGFVPWAFFR